jgi:Trypsin
VYDSIRKLNSLWQALNRRHGIRRKRLLSCAFALVVVATAAPEARPVDRGAKTNLRPEIGRFWRSVEGNPVWDCTGTLVVTDFVLTAAHCVAYSSEHPEQYFFGIESAGGFFKYQVDQIWTFGERRSWGDRIPTQDELRDCKKIKCTL